MIVPSTKVSSGGVTRMHALIIIALTLVGIGLYYLTLNIQATADNGTPVSIFDTNAVCSPTTSIPDCGFRPQNIRVQIGTNNTLTWTNEGILTHTVKSNSIANPGLPTFDSGDKTHNAKYTLTLNSAGAYHFYCKHHAWMTGSIVVSA